MKRFTPHHNASFGCFVESDSHLRALQRRHGCEDADLSGGASRHIPSGFDTREYLSRTDHPEPTIDSIENDHLEDARDTGLSIDDTAAHLGVA